MADQLGALSVPVPADATDVGAKAGDPLLDVLGSFIQAALNARAGEAWSVLAPDSLTPVGKECVRKVFQWDPEPAGHAFIDRELPALFLWRESSEPAVWIGQGWRVRQSAISLAWVFPPVDQNRQSARQPFQNAIATILDQCLEFQGRDPSWVQDGDTDAEAATRGSSLWKYAKVFRLIVGRTQSRPLVIRGPVGTSGVAPKAYFRIQVHLDVWERLEQDVSAWYDLEDGLGLKATATPDDTDLSPLVVVDGLFYFPPRVDSVTPATGDAGGGDAITLKGYSFRTGALVDIDGVPCTGVVVVDSETITAVTPAHLAGSVDVTVTDPNQSAGTKADAFTFA